MEKENDQRRVKHKYGNAKKVLPPELLSEVQKHFTGMMWVPDHTQRSALRRRLALELNGQGVLTREIAKLAGVTRRRVRQIVVEARSDVR